MSTSEQRFGEFITALRAARTWSQRRAAREIQVSSMRLAELERGVSRTTGHATRPSPDLVARIAAVYGVPRDHLRDLAGYAREHPGLGADEALLLDRFRALATPERVMVLELVAAVGRVAEGRSGALSISGTTEVGQPASAPSLPG